jgi:hypothetical protein
MPRVTIYVPDDLKAGIDAAGEAINWSAVAQLAFREAIISHRLRKDPSNMTNVIERLRLSKQRSTEANIASGKECGTKWAELHAEYEELERIHTFALEGAEADQATLHRLIDFEDEMNYHDWEDFWRDHGDGKQGDGFAEGFVEGASEVFKEVSGQL